MARASVRDKLIAAGVQALHQGGFAPSGVRDIAQLAEAPLGSFSNHFKSKEEFGLVVLDAYFDRLRATMHATLGDPSLGTFDSFAAYFDSVDQLASPERWRLGCMVPNMAHEMPAHSEAIRLRLAEILLQSTEPFADAIRRGQERGEVRTDCDAEDLALLVLAGWHGAVMRAKVEQGPAAIHAFRRILFDLMRS